MTRGALLIGGSSAIGIAIAKGLAANCCEVVGVSREPFDEPCFAARLLGDCSDPAVATRIVDKAVSILPSLDVPVLAAAVMPVALVASTTDEQWNSAFASTLDSAFFVIRAALLPSATTPRSWP